MKQQAIWTHTDKPPLVPRAWKLFVDGASRNNPGPAGVGIYLTYDAAPVEQQGFFLGIYTNNQAEYLALIIGLIIARQHDTMTHIDIISDSQLLVRQMMGQYRVKNPELQKLQKIAVALLEDLEYSFSHVLRENNQEADALANMGIDNKIVVPADIQKLLQSYKAL
ncbi:MAG: ribonuclease HI family protein [Candidatus Babeliales bacterium]